MEGYSVTIRECSKELTAKQRIQLKDTTDTIKLDTATQEQEEGIIIDPDFYAILDIHNEKSDNTDYANYVVVDKDGQRYVTGSESFWSSFMNIYKEMENETEPWSIKVYRMPSKKREGKDFITCSVI